MVKYFPHKLNTIYIVFGVSLLLSIGYVSFRFLYPINNSGIYEIGQTSITLEGRVMKDAAIGLEGNYFLMTNNSEAVLLDLQGLDSFVSQTVYVEGFLIPANSTGQPTTMTVNNIKLK